MIGIQMLIRFYRNPSKYLWIQLESDDKIFGFLDDAVVALSDKTFELIQVKFTANEEKYFLDWDWLLKKKGGGTSLLRKWSISLAKFKGERVSLACLRTNRRPDEEFQSTLKAHGRVDFDALSTARKQQVGREIGSAYAARAFFKKFRFEHSQPRLTEFEDELRDTLVPFDCDMTAWLQLVAQAKRWSMNKNQPEPDGRITHAHLTQIITKKAPRPMPQSFAIPDGYAVPSLDFHDAFKARVKGGTHPISILWGTPGRGKSTYLSFLIGELREEDVPVIRHHYFLSLDDTTSDRFSYPNIADSLIHQVASFYPDAVKGLGNDDKQLRIWIAACGKYFAEQDKPFVIMIDGLDHVYRERRTLAQLDHLFDVLLPCPPNVTLIVGTQRVPDEQLPSKLIQRVGKKDWCEIPAMDEYSVQSWVAQQYKAKRLRLQKLHRSERISEQLGSIGNAFFEVSSGHPLHLIYSFEYLVRRGGYVTPDEVRLLPPCPQGNIDQYYATLWRKLSVRAREIVHLIAGCDFRWPFADLVRCFGQIDEIDFLLEQRRTGLMAFHGSVLAFVRAKANHDAIFRSLLPRVVKWLRRDATAYYKWGWLWLMEARNGNYAPLLRGVTRDWVIDSVAAGWPLEQIVNILKVAERKVFDEGDYAETIRFRTLKHRVENCEEFQGNEFPRLLECALENAENDEAIVVLADSLTTLAEDRIAVLARVTDERDPKICDECERELACRVSLWLSLRHRPANEFIVLSKYYVEAAALAPSLDVKRVLNFIARFRDGEEVFRTFIGGLIRAKRAAEIAAAADHLKLAKHAAWRRFAFDALVEVCSVTRTDINPMLSNQAKWQLSGFAACWLRYHKVPVAGTVPVPVRPSAVKTEGRKMRPSVETYLCDVFFHALFGGLKQRKGTKPKVAAVSASGEYIDRAAALLVNVARNIASGESQLAFPTVYFAARALEPVLDRHIDTPDFHQYRGFSAALRKIAIRLHLLKQPTGVFQPVSPSELTSARTSVHWIEALLIDEQLDRALPLLTTADAAAVIAKEETYLNEHVTVFNERADKWVELARLGALYDQPGTSGWIRRAANCFVGYGWRKDLWLDEVLECIADVHEHGAADGVPMLRRLVPIVEKVTDFTDGDETDHIRSTLIEVIARVTPARLPNFYAHHIDEDEFRYAELALAEHLKISDLGNPAGEALVRTFVEYNDVSLLSDLAKNSGTAARLLDAQMAFLGGMPPKIREYSSKSSDYARTGTSPDVTKIPANQFRNLLNAVSDPEHGYDHRRESLRNWLTYWESKDKGREALQSLRTYLDEEENVHQAEDVLDEAFRVSLRVEGKRHAYPWLVLAHIHLRGWSRYFTSTERTMERLEIATSHYKADWRKFIHDTSEQALHWRRRNHDFAIGTKFLVHFLLLADQKKLAADFTRSCISVVEAETSDQRLPECPWFH